MTTTARPAAAAADRAGRPASTLTPTPTLRGRGAGTAIATQRFP